MRGFNTVAASRRDAPERLGRASRSKIREEKMGEWKIVFDGEVEGRLVTVKVYDSDIDGDEDAEPAVRVTVTSIEVGVPEPIKDGQTLLAEPTAAGASITLDPAIFSDLEEELIEIGFSPEASAYIVRTVPR
jgi:hypothetical protein